MTKMTQKLYAKTEVPLAIFWVINYMYIAGTFCVLKDQQIVFILLFL